MSAIGPGDFVEATRTYEPDEWGDGVNKGQIYRVQEIEYNDFCVCDECGGACPEVIQLVGIRTFGGSGWCHCGLKPVYRPRADVIEQLRKLPAEEMA